MADLLESVVAATIGEALSQLKEKLATICDNPSASLEELQGRNILRLEIPIVDANVDPLLWLQRCGCEQKFYWRDRDDKAETASAGVAERFALGNDNDIESLFDSARKRLDGLPESVRFWGGFRFDAERSQIDKCWQSFGRGQFVLPRMELHRKDDTCVLACNILAEEIDSLTETEWTQWLTVTGPSSAVGKMPLVRGRERTDLPTREEWESNVTATTDLIAQGKLDKLVLSRKSTIEMHSPVDPWEILSRLRKNSQACFLFGISPESDAAFVGASPELLYYRDGERVFSEAIAGTRPRGADEQDDERLAAELLDSEKDKREHQWVVSGINQALTHLCNDLTSDHEAALLKLSRVQHLLTRFKGSLRPRVGDAELLASIHPTPAVGGFPREMAIERMNQFEPFDRGWYAGPVGYVSSSSARFAVAIRCALVSADSLSMFSGAGLVAGSDPAAEWREIEDKISNFLTVIGL